MIEKLLPLKPGSVANERAIKRLAQTSTEQCRTCSCENAWSVPGMGAGWERDGIQWHSLWPGLRSWQAEVGVFTVRRCAKHPLCIPPPPMWVVKGLLLGNILFQ